jgi:hypothetical protein
MRVRARKDPDRSDRWVIEIKYWWSYWMYESTFYGPEDEAMARAKLTKIPRIIEVT